MAARLEKLIGVEVAEQITVKTFHAFGAMLLREAGAGIGLSPNFGICSEPEQQALLKHRYPEWGRREVNSRLADISAAKGQGLTPNEVGTDLAEIYQTYQQALQENGLVDFDDLVFKSVQLLANHPDLQNAYRKRFRWISVDEFQDVNLAQYRLVQHLMAPDTNVCLIGDPDQAIYGFRGATPKYFGQFRQDFPPVETLHLNQNYRSTQLILDAAAQVIEKSLVSERVKIWSDFLDRTKLVVYQAASERAEAEYTVQEIEKMIGGTSYFSIDSGRSDNEEKSFTFADFAVLHRVGAQSLPLIEAFERSGMPYQSVGQTPLTEYKDIRTILSCLSFLDNPQTIFQLEQVASKKQIALIKSFCATIDDSSSLPVTVLVERLHQFLTDNSILSVEEKSKARVELLQRRAIPFANELGRFLEAVALQKETDFYDPRADRVTLMTLHAAKGLEFPVVFIVGCEEDLLPYRRDNEVPDVEEERRLFYVGLTRAQQKLILTSAKSRFLFGRQQSNAPSRFIEDIEQMLKEMAKSGQRKPGKETPESTQLRLF
jgi:superfamily I DNA/RNA helicase